MHALKLRKVGNSIGILIPRELQERLHVAEGDTLYVTETPDGVQLTPYSPEFDQAMDAFERTRRKYRNTLKELAR